MYIFRKSKLLLFLEKSIMLLEVFLQVSFDVFFEVANFFFPVRQVKAHSSPSNYLRCNLEPSLSIPHFNSAAFFLSVT